MNLPKVNEKLELSKKKRFAFRLELQELINKYSEQGLICYEIDKVLLDVVTKNHQNYIINLHKDE